MNEEDTVVTGETLSDVLADLPMDEVSIVITRMPVKGGYITKFWTSRPVRRFYAMGLLAETQAMLALNTQEVVWSHDCPRSLAREEADEELDPPDDDPKEGVKV